MVEYPQVMGNTCDHQLIHDVQEDYKRSTQNHPTSLDLPTSTLKTVWEPANNPIRELISNIFRRIGKQLSRFRDYSRHTNDILSHYSPTQSSYVSCHRHRYTPILHNTHTADSTLHP
jgi:hypothetical protein